MKRLLIAVISLYLLNCCLVALTLDAKNRNCNVPQHLQIVVTAKNKVTLFWKKSQGTTSYQIDYRKKGTSSWLIQTTTDTFLSLEHIQELATYEWRVRTNCQGTWSAYTKVHYFNLNRSTGFTNINEKQSLVQLYPNPTSNVLNVDCRQLFFKPKTIQLLNHNGKALLQQPGAYAVKLDIRSIPNGIYFVSMSNQDHVYLHRVIISH